MQRVAATDYSWLPFPFATNNPGAFGATGTLVIVEDNTLSSSDPVSPFFIDAAAVGSRTDAVGNANVMTTRDSNWCLDMSATNVLGVTGPVLTYAKFPAGTDKGLIIYNGLDVDFLPSSPGASGRASCGRSTCKSCCSRSTHPICPVALRVVGITLTPGSASNPVGHTPIR